MAVAANAGRAATNAASACSCPSISKSSAADGSGTLVDIAPIVAGSSAAAVHYAEPQLLQEAAAIDAPVRRGERAARRAAVHRGSTRSHSELTRAHNSLHK